MKDAISRDSRRMVDRLPSGNESNLSRTGSPPESGGDSQEGRRMKADMTTPDTRLADDP